jgi:hypothetical protein
MHHFDVEAGVVPHRKKRFYTTHGRINLPSLVLNPDKIEKNI